VWVGGGAADATEFLDSRSIRIEGGPMAEGRYDVEVVNPDGGSSTLRQGLTVQTAAVNCDPITVYFETASSNLTADSNSRLQRELSCYRDSSGPIRIEGHCDERGTIDYNIALGERRARSVSRWFSGQGVEASRLSTVSFGEEKPVANGHDEQSWSQNRRAEIRLGR
jgi:peptidoglycan-associated lipoprotein